MDTKETEIYIAALIAAGVLAVILIYFIINMIRQQRISQKLYREKIEAEILTLESERKRISSDLHDDLGPVLSAIRFNINAVETNTEADEELISKASSYVDETIQKLRQISYNLLPNTLTRKGLVPALEEYIERTKEYASVDIRFDKQPIPSLPDSTAIHLFRIVQEIIHNAIKHSKATELIISISYTDKTILLRTKDNGQGFDKDKNGENSGFGLRNISSRVDIMHGQMIMETKPGKGVRYLFSIPEEQSTTND